MSVLAGKRVVNTRAIHQAGEFDELLRAHGAVPLAYPCIAIEPVADSAELDQALADLFAGEFDWLVITSVNTVHALTERTHCNASLHFASSPARLAVVGPATAEAVLCKLGLRAEVVPATYRAIDLATAMPVEPGQRVLVPQSEIASPDLAKGLTAKGAIVTTVTAYRTVTGSGGVDLPVLLARGEVDAIVFASSSAVDGCADRLRVEGEGLRDSGERGQGTGVSSANDELPKSTTQNLKPNAFTCLNGIPTFCIGPNTAKTARAYGLSPIVPAEQTLAGVLSALQTEFGALSKGFAL